MWTDSARCEIYRAGTQHNTNQNNTQHNHSTTQAQTTPHNTTATLRIRFRQRSANLRFHFFSVQPRTPAQMFRLYGVVLKTVISTVGRAVCCTLSELVCRYPQREGPPPLIQPRILWGTFHFFLLCVCLRARDCAMCGGVWASFWFHRLMRCNHSYGKLALLTTPEESDGQKGQTSFHHHLCSFLLLSGLTLL